MLAALHIVAFLYVKPFVVGIGAEKTAVVLDDDELPVTDESAAGVDNSPARRGADRLLEFSLDIDPLLPPRPKLPTALPLAGRVQLKPAATLVASGGAAEDVAAAAVSGPTLRCSVAGAFDAGTGTGFAGNAGTFAGAGGFAFAIDDGSGSGTGLGSGASCAPVPRVETTAGPAGSAAAAPVFDTGATTSSGPGTRKR